MASPNDCAIASSPDLASKCNCDHGSLGTLCGLVNSPFSRSILSKYLSSPGISIPIFVESCFAISRDESYFGIATMAGSSHAIFRAVAVLWWPQRSFAKDRMSPDWTVSAELSWITNVRCEPSRIRSVCGASAMIASSWATITPRARRSDSIWCGSIFGHHTYWLSPHGVCAPIPSTPTATDNIKSTARVRSMANPPSTAATEDSSVGVNRRRRPKSRSPWRSCSRCSMLASNSLATSSAICPVSPSKS